MRFRSPFTAANFGEAIHPLRNDVTPGIRSSRSARFNAPLAKSSSRFHEYCGPTSDVGPQYSWNRDELFASGALNLADLLERIPGVTSFRSGWMASPKFAAVNGDLNRIRVYYDGIAVDNLDARTGGLLDLNTIQLWT